MKDFKLWGVSLIVGFWLIGFNLGYCEVIDLGTLGGLERNGVAFAINDRGEAAGYTDKSDGIVHAFLYSGGVMTDLGTFGGGWSMARGINNLSQVVGYAAGTYFYSFIFSSIRPFNQRARIGSTSRQSPVSSSFSIKSKLVS